MPSLYVKLCPAYFLSPARSSFGDFAVYFLQTQKHTIIFLHIYLEPSNYVCLLKLCEVEGHLGTDLGFSSWNFYLKR